jgi:hypothetical protein
MRSAVSFRSGFPPSVSFLFTSAFASLRSTDNRMLKALPLSNKGQSGSAQRAVLFSTPNWFTR